MRTLILTGGGTAGHVIPNLALLPDFEKLFDKIVYIGGINGVEKDLLANYPSIEYYGIDCGKLRRTMAASNLVMPFKVLRGIVQAKKIIKELNPDLIFSKGGFVSVPVVLASKKIPVIAHESDITPGLANRITLSKAKKICTTFPSTAELINKKHKDKAVFCGSPVRTELFKGDRNQTLKEFGFSGIKPILLIIGGSSGARAINECVRQSLKAITTSFDIIHITGKGNLDKTLEGLSYKQVEFRLELSGILSAADIVLTRGGSNAINELAALKKPMLIIPLPKNESRGDQILNANDFEKRRIARVFLQEGLSPEKLLTELNKTYNQRHELIKNLGNENLTSGNRKIIEVIEKVLKG